MVGAVPVTDWSEELECSQDGKMHFTTKDSRMGINHLVCAGEGEGIDRKILHLYVQKDGSIGQAQYYNGLDEREALYSYTSVEDDAKLLEEGTERLRPLFQKLCIIFYGSVWMRPFPMWMWRSGTLWADVTGSPACRCRNRSSIRSCG